MKREIKIEHVLDVGLGEGRSAQQLSMDLLHNLKMTDMPQGFKDWVAENEAKQAGWSSPPYFVTEIIQKSKVVSDALDAKGYTRCIVLLIN